MKEVLQPCFGKEKLGSGREKGGEKMSIETALMVFFNVALFLLVDSEQP